MIRKTIIKICSAVFLQLICCELPNWQLSLARAETMNIQQRHKGWLKDKIIDWFTKQTANGEPTDQTINDIIEALKADDVDLTENGFLRKLKATNLSRTNSEELLKYIINCLRWTPTIQTTESHDKFPKGQSSDTVITWMNRRLIIVKFLYETHDMFSNSYGANTIKSLLDDRDEQLYELHKTLAAQLFTTANRINKTHETQIKQHITKEIPDDIANLLPLLYLRYKICNNNAKDFIKLFFSNEQQTDVPRNLQGPIDEVRQNFVNHIKSHWILNEQQQSKTTKKQQPQKTIHTTAYISSTDTKDYNAFINTLITNFADKSKLKFFDAKNGTFYVQHLGTDLTAEKIIPQTMKLEKVTKLEQGTESNVDLTKYTITIFFRFQIEQFRTKTPRVIDSSFYYKAN